MRVSMQLSLAVVILGFCTGLRASLLDDFEQTRNHNGKSIKAFIGFVDLIEGAESLIKDHPDSAVLGVQRLMEGVVSLVEASMDEVQIDADEKLSLIGIINDFKCQIDVLVQTSQLKVVYDADAERRKLMEGLAAILYNAVYMLIEPKSIGTCLANILSGVYKVVSSILADGKIDYHDWNKLLAALASIFNLSQGRLLQVQKTVIYNLGA